MQGILQALPVLIAHLPRLTRPALLTRTANTLGQGHAGGLAWAEAWGHAMGQALDKQVCTRW